jgi:hypothetical protein
MNDKAIPIPPDHSFHAPAYAPPGQVMMRDGRRSDFPVSGPIVRKVFENPKPPFSAFGNFSNNWVISFNSEANDRMQIRKGEIGMNEVLLFAKRAVPLDNRALKAGSRAKLNDRVRQMSGDLDFRRRWKHVSKIELWSNAAIFQLDDGTKWYLNIS